jgi:hypothetical protein
MWKKVKSETQNSKSEVFGAQARELVNWYWRTAWFGGLLGISGFGVSPGQFTAQ